MPTINGRACVVNGKTVDKVFSNGKQVYGRNLLLGTSNSLEITGTGAENDIAGRYSFSKGEIKTWVTPGDKYTFSFDYKLDGSDISGQLIPQLSGYPWTLLADKTIDLKSEGHIEFTVTIPGSWLWTDSNDNDNAGGVQFRTDDLFGNLTISNVYFKKGKATDWTPAPEDILK